MDGSNITLKLSTRDALVLVAACVVSAAFGQASPLRIVVPPTSSPLVQRAAVQLGDYLERMGNPKVEIVAGARGGDLFMGCFPSFVSHQQRHRTLERLQRKPQQHDAFLLRSFGRHLVIDGNSPRAIEYGTYAYLESLGVRWYFPGRDGEIVPRHHLARFSGYDIVSIPSFRKRGVVTISHRVLFAHHPQNYEQPGFRDFVAFAAHKRLNTVAIHQYYDFREAAKIIEYYGLRAQQETHYFGGRYCPDNSASLQQNVAWFKDYLAQAPPSMRQFFLWPADENLPVCTSPQVRDWRVSDLTLNFSNEMNRILQEKRPGAEFAFIAYLRTWEPPSHVKPDRGVLLEWAPMDRSSAYTITDSSSSVNARLRTELEQYLKLFSPAKSQVLGYWLDDSLSSRSGLPNLPFQPKVLQGDLRYYRSLGIPAITTFGVFSMRNMFFSKAPPVVFLYPDLLWDTNLDVDKELREFCRLYYGDEAAYAVLNDIQKLDGIVYEENDSLKVDTSRLPEFNATLMRGVQTAETLMERHQNNRTYRSRLAKLLNEVASRANYRRPKEEGAIPAAAQGK